MPTNLWKPVETANEALDRYATQATIALDNADTQPHAGDLDVYNLRNAHNGHHLTAIAYLLRALTTGQDPDEAAAMVPTLLDPAGPARTWASILTPTEAEGTP